MTPSLQGSRLYLVIFSSLLFIFNAFADPRPIRLRNEQFTPPAKTQNQLRVRSANVKESGLFLIQFTNTVQTVWRDALATNHVKFLKYVPDNTYIVHIQDEDISRLATIPFVQWIGPYKATHKIHAPLLTLPATNLTRIKILLSTNVSPAEIFTLQRLLGAPDLKKSSRFGQILEGNLMGRNLNTIALSPAVLWMEGAGNPRLFDAVASKIVGGDDGNPMTPPYTQQLGYDGSGVAVAVADSGLHNGKAEDMHPDLRGRVDSFLYYGNLTSAADEHSHGTHVSGIIAGNGATGERDELGYLYGLGVAPAAHIVVQRIFDGLGGYEAPATYEVLTHDAVRAGAVIGSNSWGDDTQGRYDISAAEFDALVRDADADTPGDQQYILEFSAGNAGPGEQTVGSPAVAKNVIATGASDNDRPDFIIYADGIDAIADFSSRGPAEDGRIKPDVVAPGTWIASLQSASGDPENAWAVISGNYQYEGGTSQAGPHVSGAAAVFVQYYRETHNKVTPSPALVKAALINSAIDMDNQFGTSFVPNNDEGWGRVDLSEIIGSGKKLVFVDQTTTLTNQQVYEKRVVIASDSLPLKITMAYTDVPGFPGAIPALVNDLDLEVIAPDGNVYHGNGFADGESFPNPVGYDNINNVEAVNLSTPIPGEYVIRIHAKNVVEDARRDTALTDQDFALVVSADIPLPGQGFVFLNKDHYTSPETVQIKLIDFDLTQPSVSIRISSGTEPGGENAVLASTINPGTYVGSINLVTGTAAADGKLQVSNGDTITVTYLDGVAQTPRTTTALVDLVAPSLFNVSVTNKFGRMVISWDSDESGSSIVNYGTTKALGSSVTGPGNAIHHAVSIDNLVAGTTYYFSVVTYDLAGNATTNNNNGQYFSFVAVQAAPILLVNAYVPSDPDFGAVIPVTAYTAALDQIDVRYEVWDVASQGSPTFNQLKPFRIVMWRINDGPVSSDTLSSSQQTAIQSFVNNGGGFFMSSMEVLSRLGVSPGALAFRTNVLHVASFEVDKMVESTFGLDNDPISSGIDMTLDYSAWDSPILQQFGIFPDFSDWIVPTTNAVSVFFDSTSFKGTGIKYPKTGQDSTGRVAFLSFPLESVSMTDASPNNRPNLLKNIISFLAPGINGFGTVALDQEVYNDPSRVVVEVADSDLKGTGHLTVKAFTTTSQTGMPVALVETTIAGVFRGSFTLVTTNRVAGPNQIAGKNDDTLWVEYLDESGGTIVRATSYIDTIAPTISNVQTESEYGEAIITFDTSELSDALVQYGESRFLGKTAYSDEPTLAHSVIVPGLLPDQLYYYQLTARDAAGNTVVDDNQGRFYTFKTLKPVTPPWSDNLENSGTNWTVVNGDLSSIHWQLGRPNNSQATSAFSGTNAWGCNLNGQSFDQGQTFLVSPAFDLKGGNTATVSFWHTYDTPNYAEDIGEVLQLMISTNNGTGWITLTDYSGTTPGWELEEVDLSPYIGNIVRIGWYYELLSFQPYPRPGWLVDDVAVDVTTVIPSLLIISNNLAQASWTLTGPLPRTGHGVSTTITNPPPGTYVLTPAAVAYYNTPAPVTNQLTQGATLRMGVTYTFPDVNNNGISDLWEQQYFNAVSPGRTSTTDTDGDGVSDLREFRSGTDPTSTTSRLGISTIKGNNSLTLQWPTVQNFGYQVQGSADVTHWNPLSPWFSGNSLTNSFLMTPGIMGSNYMFRLEVRP